MVMLFLLPLALLPGQPACPGPPAPRTEAVTLVAAPTAVQARVDALHLGAADQGNEEEELDDQEPAVHFLGARFVLDLASLDRVALRSSRLRDVPDRRRLPRAPPLPLVPPADHPGRAPWVD